MVKSECLPERIGLIGGGQLGRMLILAGRPLGLRFAVLDALPDAPAAVLADLAVTGGLYEREALERLAAWADITTYEIEHTSTDILQELSHSGARFVPDVALLALINDKLRQKQALERAGIPVPNFVSEHPGAYPLVQKSRYGGYDGRGVAVLRGPEDEPLSGPCYFEELVDLQRELAVLVARRPSGKAVAYPPVDMEFHPGANIVTRVAIPARVPEDVGRRATEIALRAAESLDAAGIIAVELFWTADDEVLVNEIAPRPHNSGHITIEACETSQFEQHLRAICDLPLGSTTLRSPAVSVNLLGAPGATGPPDPSTRNALLRSPGAHVHWYGKKDVRPYRKMGHVTITASTAADAAAAADALGEHTWVGGTE